ncbi:uncharacterized protein LOC103793415 [Callithrix jacchus]
MAEPERTGARAAGAAADAASSRRRPAAVAAEAPPPPPLLAPHHPAGPPLPAPARAPGSRSLRQLSPGRGSTRTHANPGRQRAGPRRAQRGVRGRAAARIGAAGPTGGPGPGRRGEEERARVGDAEGRAPGRVSAATLRPQPGARASPSRPVLSVHGPGTPVGGHQASAVAPNGTELRHRRPGTRGPSRQGAEWGRGSSRPTAGPHLASWRRAFRSARRERDRAGKRLDWVGAKESSKNARGRGRTTGQPRGLAPKNLSRKDSESDPTPSSTAPNLRWVLFLAGRHVQFLAASRAKLGERRGRQREQAREAERAGAGSRESRRGRPGSAWGPEGTSWGPGKGLEIRSWEGGKRLRPTRGRTGSAKGRWTEWPRSLAFAMCPRTLVLHRRPSQGPPEGCGLSSRECEVWHLRRRDGAFRRAAPASGWWSCCAPCGLPRAQPRAPELRGVRGGGPGGDRAA